MPVLRLHAFSVTRRSGADREYIPVGLFYKRALAMATAVIFFAAPPALAKHNGAELAQNHGNFRIIGIAAKNSCAAQTDQLSTGAKLVALSIYWRPDESIHLLFRHPDVDPAKGKTKLRFRFPDGTDLAFNMTPVGTMLQMPLGLAHNIPTLFYAVKNNPNVEIDIIGIDDKLKLDLAEWPAVWDAMEACGTWLE